MFGNPGIVAIFAASGLSTLHVNYHTLKAGHIKAMYCLDWTRIKKGQIQRVFFSQFAFENSQHVLLTLFLLYSMRIVEIRQGPRKFFSRSLVIYLFSVGFQLALSIPSPTPFALGPYSFISAMMMDYYLEVPRCAESSIFGVSTFKLITYCFNFALFTAYGRQSLIPALCGIFSWWVVRMLPPLREFRIPKFVWDPVAEMCGRLRVALSSFLLTPNPRQPRGRNQQQAQQQAPQVQADAGLLQQLMAMGIEENMARQALISSGNNLDNALAILFQ